MTSGIYFPLCCIFFNALIMYAYFSKQRIKNIENKLYKVLVISNFFGLVIEILCYFFVRNVDAFPVLSNIVLRSYLFYLCFFIAAFTDYNAVITYNSKYGNARDINKFFNKISKLTIILVLCEIPFFTFLPMHIYNDNNIVAYTYGPAVYFVYFVAVVSMCIWLFNMIINFRKLKDRKYLPMFSFLAIGTIATIIQYYFPAMLLMTSMETLVISLMFHTIENPDLQMLRKMEAAKMQAEKANRAKSDFLSSMSHEIRTPLNAIVGFSECNKTSKTLEEAQEYSDDIIMASHTLLDIVNGILDISKIEAEKMEIVDVEYNPRQEFTDLEKLINVRIGEKDIKLNTSFAEDLPNTLYGDRGKVKQVITNLLTNAVKYTEKGQIDFIVNCINSKGSSKLSIIVKDTGRGIKKDQIDKLFTKFNRLEEDRNTTIEGTGLGLAITKSLVEMMGGKIIVQSEYGVGSTFTVYLEQKIIDGSTSKEIKEEQEEIVTYDGKKILIVDDNKLNLKVASRIFKDYNFIIEEAESGFECLEKVDNNSYDIIFMDIMMPKMGGVETFRKLKEKENFNTPVVALTADAMEGKSNKYLEVGFSDYLSKPIDRSQLQNALKKILSKNFTTVEEKTPEQSIDDNSKKLLLLSEQIIDKKLIEKHIKNKPIKVDIATNSKECIEYLKNNKYNLLLITESIDYSSIEKLNKIKEYVDLDIKSIAIINDHYNDLDKYYNAGFNNIIYFPLNRETVKKLIVNISI